MCVLSGWQRRMQLHRTAVKKWCNRVVSRGWRTWLAVLRQQRSQRDLLRWSAQRWRMQDLSKVGMPPHA